MDDLNLPPVSPAVAAPEQAAPQNLRASETRENSGSESLAHNGSSTSHSDPTLPSEPAPRRGAARRDWVVIAVCVVALMAMGVWLFRAGPQKRDVARPEPKRVSRDEFVTVGGVRRPASDVRRMVVPTEEARSADAYYGTTPGVDPKTNPQVASVYEALKEHKYPERVSVMIPPQPYDKRAFQADPQRYLNVAEPGRVWQVKQPGPGVPILGGVGELAQTLEQGQPTVLKVNGAPGSPVTFTSLDLGAFENQLTTITVRADSKGIAKTAFTGTSGTMGLVHILAGSPESSGVVRFIVDVEPPRKSAFAGR